jgi:Protein of unknown function (DUF3175)
MADKDGRQKWSGEVTEHSNALDVEPRIFTDGNASEIAKSLRRSAELSDRKRSSPFRAAMSMLTFYINRAGRNLPIRRKRTLEAAKDRLRQEFGRED